MLAQDIYLKGNWDLEVGIKLPEETNIYQSSYYRPQYKVHSTVLSEDDFYDFMY